jgi:phage-related protein
VVVSAIKILEPIIGSVSKILTKLDSLVDTVKGIMKGIPDAITGLLEKKAVNTALGSKKIAALQGLGATVSGTMTKMSDKVDEVMGSLKKTIQKHGDEAASSVDEIVEGTDNIYKWMDDLEATTWQEFSHQTAGKYGSDMDQRVADWYEYKTRKGITQAISEANSTVLRKNLEKAGTVVPDYTNAAHHIVAGGAGKADEAQKILAKFDIDINDASNGVFLPTVEDASEALYHPSLHTNEYYETVNTMLRRAENKDDALEILDDIAEQLLDGTFMN